VKIVHLSYVPFLKIVALRECLKMTLKPCPDEKRRGRVKYNLEVSYVGFISHSPAGSLFLQCNSCIFHREYTSDPVF
jgi:hypothetical protein